MSPATLPPEMLAMRDLFVQTFGPLRPVGDSEPRHCSKPTEGAHTMEIDVYGFPMTVTFDWDNGEPAIRWGDNAHPGTPPAAVLETVHVGGVNITDMLDKKQYAQIEQDIVDRMAG